MTYTSTMTKRFAIIDGKSVFYRGYYAMPNLSTRDGTPTGGVYGFAALSLELIKKLKPDYVCVAWDKAHTNIRKRKALYPEYKAPDFYAQIPMLMELLEAFSWPLYEADDYEADDIMCTLAEQADQQGIETCLITSDLDSLQCLGPRTHVYALKKGFSNIELFHPESFTAKYGIRTDQFLDLKSMKRLMECTKTSILLKRLCARNSKPVKIWRISAVKSLRCIMMRHLHSTLMPWM